MNGIYKQLDRIEDVKIKIKNYRVLKKEREQSKIQKQIII